MAYTPRVVCWRNRDEWMVTYQNLFSFENPQLQRRGIERVAAWKSRSGGKLPLAIESTSNLITAHLTLRNSCGTSPVCTNSVQKKLILAMALVRFVNGMVDLEQKGMYARSMQSIAEEIGLPDWLIDLRHEATHANFPSLETLQSGLRVALLWLREEYWEAQITKHDEHEERIVRLLRDYKDKAMSDLVSKNKSQTKKTKGKKRESLASSNSGIIQDIVSLALSSNSWFTITSTLLQEHMLLCSQEDLTKLEVEWSNPIDGWTDSLPRLPSKLITLWRPLLEALSKVSPEFLPSLLFGLLEQIPGTAGNQISAGSAGWVNYLLCSASSPGPSDALDVTVDLPWFALLEVSLSQPSLYSPALVSVILENMPAIPTGLQQKIKTLVSAYLHPNDASGHAGKLCNGSVRDLQELFTRKRKERTSETKTTEGDYQKDPGEMWSLCSGPTVWHKVPLGEVLGAEDKSLNNLELFPELNETGGAGQFQEDRSESCVVQGSGATHIEKAKENEVIFDADTEVIQAPGEDLVTNDTVHMEVETLENVDNAPLDDIAENVWLF